MSKANKITNTTKDVRENPIRGLITAMPGGIEASEQRGQRELVESEVLPADMQRDDRAALEAAGVVFGKHVGGDTLFLQVKLPVGWKKVATGHAMWSDLVDDRGRKRAGIFYKAAFYDRKAQLSVLPRFSVRCDFDDADEPERGKRGRERFHVYDGEKIIHTTDRLLTSGYVGGEWKESEAEVAAIAWLTEHWPEWKSKVAYWSEPR